MAHHLLDSGKGERWRGEKAMDGERVTQQEMRYVSKRGGRGRGRERRLYIIGEKKFPKKKKKEFFGSAREKKPTGEEENFFFFKVSPRKERK